MNYDYVAIVLLTAVICLWPVRRKIWTRRDRFNKQVDRLVEKGGEIMRNNKGYMHLITILTYAAMAGVLGTALSETSKNGVLQKQGQVIVCEAKGGSKQSCAEKYSYDRNANRTDYSQLRKVVMGR